MFLKNKIFGKKTEFLKDFRIRNRYHIWTYYLFTDICSKFTIKLCNLIRNLER